MVVHVHSPVIHTDLLQCSFRPSLSALCRTVFLIQISNFSWCSVMHMLLEWKNASGVCSSIAEECFLQYTHHSSWRKICMVLWTERLERIDNHCTCMLFACVSICHIHRGPSLFITSYNLVASPTKTKARGTFLRQLVHSVQSKLSGKMKLSRFYSGYQRGTLCSVSRAQSEYQSELT